MILEKCALPRDEWMMAFKRPHEPNGDRVYPDGITREEDIYIQDVWRASPNAYDQYRDAIRRIAEDKVEPRKSPLPTADYAREYLGDG
jgi:hypothetical protein